MTAAARPARSRRWRGVAAWTLWALAMLPLVAIAWSDHRLRQAGRPDLAQLEAVPVVGFVSAATVGAVLASRRPRHPVGWLLTAMALSLLATGAAAQYLVYGLVRPGSLPGARYAAVYYPATAVMGLALIGLVLLLTPTGSPPSPRWRWLAGVMVATPVALFVTVTLVTLAGGSSDLRFQAVGSPFDIRGLGGVVLVANQVALAVTVLAVGAAAWSLVLRFRRATGTERQQLRWVAFAAALVALAGVAALAAVALGIPALLTWAVSVYVVVLVAVLPLMIGVAILRYRLYDLDRVISRTLAYGVLTLLLGGCYAGVVVLLSQLLGSRSSLTVASATLAVAAAFQPARRRVQAAVDRRFNRRRYDAARTIQAFGARLRHQVDLDSLTGELLAVVDQTMQPTRASLWLRPSATASQDRREAGALRAAGRPTAASLTVRAAP